ncbi:MAG: VCBS repeat-containing protein [Cyclobacteriaceae bacterium]
MRKRLLMIPAVALLIQVSCAQEPDIKLPYQDVTSTHLISNGLGSNTMDAAVVDIDKDGDLDVILAMEYVENILLINDGTGRLVDESKDRFPRVRHDSEDIAVADFDNDGDLDVIFVSEDDQVNEYYENIGNAHFKAVGNRWNVQGTSNSVESSDLNGDGNIDLVIGNSGQNFILINNGDGIFKDETALRLPTNTYTTQDLELADVDGDGDLDIVEGNETHNRILINNGNGVFADESSNRLPKINDQTREIDLGDVDNDGDLDIVCANVDFGGFGDPQNRLLLNDGKGNFTEATDRLPQSNFRTVDMDFADLNNDGILDVLMGNRFNGHEKLAIINDGSLNFSDQTKSLFPEIDMYVFDYQFADFNNDGINDIYLCGFRGGDRLFFGVRK